MKEIPLANGKVVIVDDEDYERLVSFSWYACGLGGQYAARHKPGQKRGHTWMHREILKPLPGVEIDHINGNGLDNRKENLRPVSHRQNERNRHHTKKPKTSRFPGVSYQKPRYIRKDGTPSQMKPWKASIEYFPGKDSHIGMYSTEEEAYNAYRIITNLLTGEILPEIPQSGG